MQSFLNTAVKGLKSHLHAFAATAIAALSLLVLASSAQALTISVGTGTAVQMPFAVRSYKADVLPHGDQSFFVIYTTAATDGSSYSIMFASQTRGASSGGGAGPGWTVTTLFSTTTNASNTNIAAIMDGRVYSSGQILIYYYDAALGQLRCITGNAGSTQLPPVSVATATVAAIKVPAIGANAVVAFSSRTASGRYELRYVSRVIANAAADIGASAVQITTAGVDNASGSFDVVAAADDANITRVYYYDALTQSLKEVLLDSAFAPIESSRGTLDTGVIANIFAADAGTGGSAQTRLVYTVGGDTIRYAVQRRGISSQCWYIQKIDGGTAAQRVTTTSDPVISYLKGGNLWVGLGSAGAFFDDFRDNIMNNQAGLASIVSNVTAGAVYQMPTGAARDRGVYIPSSGASAIGTFNWTYLRGTVKNSFGTTLPSMKIADVVTGSAAVVGSASFPGSATLDPTTSANTAGGLTDGTGAYTIAVASGSVNAVSVSSSPTASTSWVFVTESSRTQVSYSTLSAVNNNAVGTAADLNANFIAFSSPTLDEFNVDGASQRTSTFSVVHTEGLDFNSINFDIVSKFANGGTISQGLTRSMSFRLIPQSAQGTAATVAIATFTDPASGGIELSGLSATALSATGISTNTFWARFASTEPASATPTTPGLPKWYTLVASSRTDAGHILLGTMTDALNLRPLEINFTTVTAGAIKTIPGLSVINSTGLINTSSETSIVIRSSFPYIFNQSAVNANIYLTTSNVAIASLAGAPYASDIPLSRSLSITANGSTITAHGSIMGADHNQTYYVRIATRPNAPFIPNNPQIVFSQPINFTTAAITSVAIADTGDTALSFSSASVRIAVNGRGFIEVGVSTVAISTSSAVNPDTGLPTVHAGTVQNFTVISSTAMILNYKFAVSASTFGTRYHVFYGTVTTRAGVIPGTFGEGQAIVGSTLIVNSSLLGIPSGVLVMSTPAITSIEPTTVSNTRTWDITLKGRGLLPGSTVTAYAIDGSTRTLVATAGAAAGTGFGFEASTSVLSVTLDFRSPIMAGKQFYIAVSSIFATVQGDLAAEFTETSLTSTNTIRITSGQLITVSSMNVNIGYPKLNGTNASTIYDSTPSLTVGLYGFGLVDGSTINIASLMRGATVGIPATGLPGATSSTGAFAAFTSTHFHNLAGQGLTAGDFAVEISTLLNIFGRGVTKFQASTTATVNVTAAALTNAVAASHTSPLNSTLINTSFTVTGTGLLPSVTFYLQRGANGIQDRVGAVSVATNAANFSSLSVVFDLRAASSTADWTFYGVSNNPSGSTQTLTSAGSAISITTITVLSALPTATKLNTGGNQDIAISGQGLTLGATSPVIHVGSLAALQASRGTTDYVGGIATDVSMRIGTVTAINGFGPAAQTTGTLTVDLTNAAPSSLWVLKISTFIDQGTYGGLVPQPKDDNGTGNVASRKARIPGLTYESDPESFTIAESSAPNAPTGLSVLSAGTASVTLRWVSPGDNGFTENLVTGSQFIVYYSSGNGDRGTGCAPCYPVNAINGNIGLGGVLAAGASNFTFTNTWAQYLPGGYANSQRSTDTNFSPSFFQVNSTNSVRGLVVSTVTLPIASVTVKTSSNATGTTGATSIVPGRLVEARLTIDPGTTPGDFWFVVRAQDESGNLSSPSIVYSTATARIGASAVVQTTTIDPNATTVIPPLDIGGGITQGGSIPPGALDASDTISQIPDTNPPADSGGVDLIGPAVDITLGSGRTEFNKAITLTFALTGAALSEINSKTSNFNLVKVAFFNGSRWVIIPESSFDGATVSCQVSHLTKFGVAIAAPPANLSGATAYPNPFRTTVAAQVASGLKFDTLPAFSTIKIFTLAGDLVKQLDDPLGTGIITWNAKNEDGQDVASGVYFALIKGGGDTKTLKVAVQR